MNGQARAFDDAAFPVVEARAFDVCGGPGSGAAGASGPHGGILGPDFRGFGCSG